MALEVMNLATFDTAKVKLNYAEGPNAGPALVLLHGGSARWPYFDGIILDLAAHWHVFAPDLRGHGKSGRVAWRYALQDYVEDIGAFLREVSGPATLFGHSLGGMVAWMVAGQCPELVTAVVVGDSPLDRDVWKANTDEHKLAQTRSWRALAGGSHSVEEIIVALKDCPATVPGQTRPLRMRDVYADDDGVYAHLAPRLYDNDPDMIGVLLEDRDNFLAGYEMETLLPSIHCPVLLLQADPKCGSAMSDVEADRAMTLLPQASHVLFPGLSHLLFIENKTVVLQAVEAFRAQVRATV